MDKLVILLGSNIGNKKVLLLRAKQLLEAQLGKCLQISSLYESEAWGFKSENTFLNQVLSFETKLNPKKVLQIGLEIEKELGRIKKNGSYISRTIDVDILFYGDKIIDEIDLEIPHPRLHLRRFTLVPLAELMPNFVHPKLKKTINELLLSCQDKISSIKMKN